MLVRLTLSCNENCTHCMVGANPDGQHMDSETFEQLLDFCRRLYKDGLTYTALVVTGGEITLHPQWVEYCRKIAECVPQWTLLLESNGAFVDDSDQRRAMKDVLRTKNIRGLQVSTHEKYYPNYAHTMENRRKLTSINSSKVFLVDNWQGKLTHLIRLGRARGLDFEPEGKPGCANLLLVALQSVSFSRTLNALSQKGRFCIPSIDPDGTVRMGETPFCTRLGTVESSLDDLYRSLVKSPLCNACGCVKNIPANIMAFITDKRPHTPVL